MHLQADWYRQREEKSALLSGCSCLWPADMERVEIHQSHSGRSLKFVCVCVYESVRLCLSVLKCADLCITLYECVQYVSGCSPAGMRACMHTHLHESSRAWGGVNPSECMNVICEKMQFCLWVVFHTCVWVYAFKCRYCECWSFIFIHTLVPYGFFLFFSFSEAPRWDDAIKIIVIVLIHSKAHMNFSHRNPVTLFLKEKLHAWAILLGGPVQFFIKLNV